MCANQRVARHGAIAVTVGAAETDAGGEKEEAKGCNEQDADETTSLPCALSVKASEGAVSSRLSLPSSSSVSECVVSRPSHARLLRELRAITHSLRARLLSIEADTYRVLSLYTQLFPHITSASYQAHHLPLFGNARAGAWYVPPCSQVSTEFPACFKSCDGHYGHWGASIRRPNVHVLQSAKAFNGVLIVDATRAGKVFPDALTKTVPLWCALMNTLVLKRESSHHRIATESEHCHRKESHHVLHVHPKVPPSEAACMHSLLPRLQMQWTLNNNSINSKSSLSLSLPLRCLWMRAWSHCPWPHGLPSAHILNFLPVLCVSASDAERRYVEARTHSAHVLGIRFPARPAFEYVPGAADDEETWANGLDYKMFWESRFEILGDDVHANMDDAQVVRNVQNLVRKKTEKASNTQCDARRIGKSKVSIMIASPEHACYEAERAVRCGKYALVMVLGGDGRTLQSVTDGGDCARVKCIPLRDRRGREDGKHALARALGGILGDLRQVCTRKCDDDDGDEARVLLLCTRGGDAATGVAIAWCAWHCDFGGQFEVLSMENRFVGKNTVKSCMLALLTLCPTLGVARNTLQQINRFFQSPRPPSRVDGKEEKEEERS